MLLALAFVVFGCRQENSLIENEQQSKNLKISVLEYDQVQSQKSLINKISDLESKVFKKGMAAKSVQDSLFDGAIIETNKILLIEDGDQKTYTFPVSRIYPNNKIENLVLRKNKDNSYSGALFQYNLTEIEKQKYIKGIPIDLAGKIKSYIINDISISNKGGTYSYYDGCWEYIYETHPCAGSEHHGVGAACPLAGTPSQAQPNTIIAAVNHCGEESGGSSGAPSGPGPGAPSGPGPGPGAGPGTPGSGSNTGGGPSGSYIPPANPYNTFMFISYDDMYILCAEGDTQCAENWTNMSLTVQLFNALNRNGTKLPEYTETFLFVKDYLISNAFSPDATAFISERLNTVGYWLRLQDNSTDEKRLNNHKFALWALKYFVNVNSNGFEYYKNNPLDLDIIRMEGIDSSDYEFANESANIITDVLINNQNGTLNNLDISWPNLETLKQKVKQAISYGVYTTAKYTRNYLYLPMYKMGQKYPSTIYWSNKAIDKIRLEAVTPMVDFNTDTMKWGDLFNIWLFELTPGHFTNNNINFTGVSNVVNGNDIYNPSTNAVKNFSKGNGNNILNISAELANGLPQGGIKSGYFTYDVNAFYSTLSNANLGIQMLGSFPIKGYILSKSSHSAVVQFTITNNLGWESGTRFIKGNNGNIGVIDDKPVGSGLHLGGTISNIFTWTETVNF